jgi:hypothetical protein
MLSGIACGYSSSILGIVFRIFSMVLFLSAMLGPLVLPVAGDDAPVQKRGNLFFAGNVTQYDADMITVGRTVRGKAESRSFHLSPETKIEGQLTEKARVTVRYLSDENGDTATMIVVHTSLFRRLRK